MTPLSLNVLKKPMFSLLFSLLVVFLESILYILSTLTHRTSVDNVIINIVVWIIERTKAASLNPRGSTINDPIIKGEIKAPIPQKAWRKFRCIALYAMKHNYLK